MHAVLPILAKDFDRVDRLLLPSLKSQAPWLTVLWIIVPGRAVAAARALFAQAGPFEIRVRSELSVVPERLVFGTWRKGWYVQQLIKMAMAEHVEGEFYLSLDCDLVCTRPTTLADFVVHGRGVLEILPGQERTEWYSWAERVLRMKPASREMGVTPALYNTAAMRGLQAYLGARCSWRVRALAALLAVDARSTGAWRLSLLLQLPWIEMALYLTYLESTGLDITVHTARTAPALAGNNFWDRAQFEQWDPSLTFSPAASYPFSVLASSSGVTVDEVLARIN